MITRTDPSVVVSDALWTALAAIGGVAKYLGNPKEPFSPKKMLVKAFVSGFSGYLFAQMIVLMAGNAEWAMIAAGVGGYMGTEAIDFVIWVVTNRFKFPL